MECLDCVETTARLHLYIDRELNSTEIEIVQQHLADCPNCGCRFQFDMHLKKLIHERCTIVHAPDHLREAVMRLARGEDGDIDPAVAREIKADMLGF